jgi:uncharacterized protein
MRKTLLIIVISMLCCMPAEAVVVSGLYEAEVPVPDQSAKSHKQGLAHAMLEVLVKLTGDREVQGRQVTSVLTGQPEKYVQQYKYRNKPVFRDNQLSLEQQLYLWVSFSPDALDNALRDYAVPLWGKVRPSTLVWLVVGDAGKRDFVGLEDETGYTAIMDNRAQSRGLVLIHPLFDNRDRELLQVADIWGGFMGPVIQASERYAVDVILTGIVEHLPDGWEGRWSASFAGETRTWNTRGEQAEEVLQQGIDTLTDLLAARYVHTATYTTESGVEVVVKDIATFEEYSTVLKYLRSLNSVTNVDVTTVEPGSVTFAITATGGAIAIQRAIELGQLLQPLTGSGSPYRLLH